MTTSWDSKLDPELSHPRNSSLGGGNVHTDVHCPPNDGFGGWLLEIDRFGSKAAAPLAKRPASGSRRTAQATPTGLLQTEVL